MVNGTKIKLLREEKNLSQNQLAQLIGIEQSTLNRIESGINANPSVRIIEAIAQYFNVPFDALLIWKSP